MKEPEEKPTAAIDFDGVLAHWEEGQDINTVGSPIPKGFQLAKKLRAHGYKVVVLTARPPELHTRIALWLHKQGFIPDAVTNVKPPAELYIDDRAIPFQESQEYGVKGMKWGVRKKEEPKISGYPRSEEHDRIDSVVSKHFEKIGYEALEAGQIGAVDYSLDDNYDGEINRAAGVGDWEEVKKNFKTEWDPEENPRHAIFAEAGVSEKDYTELKLIMNLWTSEDHEVYKEGRGALESAAAKIQRGDLSDPMAKALYVESMITRGILTKGSFDPEKTVALFRGVHGSAAKSVLDEAPEKGGGINLSSDSADSWSADASVAQIFSEGSWRETFDDPSGESDEDFDERDKLYSALVAAKVPVKFILTGRKANALFFRTEDEYIVSLPEKFKARRY